MRASVVYFLCAILAAAGVLLLAAYAQGPAPAQKASIASLGSLHDGARVEVSGQVKSVYARNGNMFMTLCAGSCTQAVIFKSALEKINSEGAALAHLKKGSHVRVFGTASKYQGETDLVIERIEVLN